MIPRTIEKEVEQSLFKGKAVIIYGARQVGKTTLARVIGDRCAPRYLYLNCDEPDIRAALTDKTSTELKRTIGDYPLVLIDEAQRVHNIGLTLKLIVDNYPENQLIVTGSSSFDLSNKINEPLTGRKREFQLFPLSWAEINHLYTPLEKTRLLPELMIKGFYPEVVQNPRDASRILSELTLSYLYKDILSFQEIRNSDALDRLLKALALQVGSEVSYNELALTCGIDKKTVNHYVQVLEKAFIIYRVQPFSRNIRNELKKNRKIYFVDNGIRNALIRNLNPLNLRNDTGHLWENFLFTERIKRNANQGINALVYFWRNHQQKEIDFIEEYAGVLKAYEFKWKETPPRLPKEFLEAYPDAGCGLVHPGNMEEFLS